MLTSNNLTDNNDNDNNIIDNSDDADYTETTYILYYNLELCGIIEVRGMTRWELAQKVQQWK